MSYVVNGWSSSTSQGKLTTSHDYVGKFIIKIVNDGYWCSVYMWQTFSIRMSLLICTC
jgi:hypothetical protein